MTVDASQLREITRSIVPSMAEQLASVYIIAFPKGDESSYEIARLQYFPESLNDSKEVEYTSKNIPGASHPIYQWISGGDRTIEFDIVLSRESLVNIPGIYSESIMAEQGQILSELGITQPFTIKGDKRNVDVDAAVNWLRSLCYPTYLGRNIYPPPKLTLIFGQTVFRFDEKKYMDCIMTSFSVEYKDWFNDGTPRLAICSVSFSEIVQKTKGKITYIGRENLTSQFKSRFIIGSR